jgi:hypothetical protein
MYSNVMVAIPSVFNHICVNNTREFNRTREKIEERIEKRERRGNKKMKKKSLKGKTNIEYDTRTFINRKFKFKFKHSKTSRLGIKCSSMRRKKKKYMKSIKALSVTNLINKLPDNLKLIIRSKALKMNNEMYYVKRLSFIKKKYLKSNCYYYYHTIAIIEYNIKYNIHDIIKQQQLLSIVRKFILNLQIKQRMRKKKNELNELRINELRIRMYLCTLD